MLIDNVFTWNPTAGIIRKLLKIFLVNETKRRTEFQFLSVLRLYMFRAAFLPIIMSS